MPKTILLRAFKPALSGQTGKAPKGAISRTGGRGHADVERVSAGIVRRPLKRFGLLKGRLNLPDDLESPLPDDAIRSFEGDD